MKERMTKEELKRIWKGLMYHISELMDFVMDNKDSKFFKTKLGEKMADRIAKISWQHVMGMMDLDKDEDTEGDLDGDI